MRRRPFSSNILIFVLAFLAVTFQGRTMASEEAEGCFSSCQDLSNDDFVVCMASCKACNMLCDGLENSHLSECVDRCEVVKDIGAREGALLKTIVISYELQYAVQLLSDLQTELTTSLDPVFDAYIGSSEGVDDLKMQYKDMLEYVDKLDRRGIPRF